jgi:hypothetical protein
MEGVGAAKDWLAKVRRAKRLVVNFMMDVNRV